MNKVFWFLVVMCFVSAGVLWWLLRIGPSPDAHHFSENKNEMHQAETVENVVKDEVKAEEKVEEKTEETHQENAAATSEAHEVNDLEKKIEEEKSIAKEGPEAPPEVAVEMVVGKRGPFFLQLGSVPVEEWLRGNLDLTPYQGAVACKVNIPAKGESVRILMGPFENKKMAMKAKEERESIPADSFVTGEQKCLQ